MKKYNLFILILIFSLNASQAQLLWKISGHGLEKPSYLFGTHHLIPIQFLDSVPGLYKAFNSTQTVVSEVVLNNLDTAPAIQRAALLPDSITIQTLLSKTDYDFANEEITKTLRMSLNSLNKMHPSLIAKFYELELYKTVEHFDENTKSDSYFQLVAAQKGIPVVGLETVEKQLNLLFPKNYQKEAQLLIETIRNKDKLIGEINEMNQMYRKAKIYELEKLASQSNKRWNVSEEENYVLVDERNIDWIRQLPELLNKSSCFIAVGVLHLPGTNGLINLLKKEGYKVTAIN
ncbi:MAG TPA: TraB/GumN family protein [Paludibacteraceae bacterium]|nr:TraB/GumN family protein [Paludibacteraceae bacterium]HPT43176.1 TraB/GumN family protein [Paludibacteraceae bacterium]